LKNFFHLPSKGFPQNTQQTLFQRMRIVKGKFNTNPRTVGDVLENILNNFKLDRTVIGVIMYIITNTTACDLTKQVSDFEPQP
jgi:hypothetical protein